MAVNKHEKIMEALKARGTNDERVHAAVRVEEVLRVEGIDVSIQRHNKEFFLEPTLSRGTEAYINDLPKDKIVEFDNVQGLLFRKADSNLALVTHNGIEFYYVMTKGKRITSYTKFTADHDVLRTLFPASEFPSGESVIDAAFALLAPVLDARK